MLKNLGKSEIFNKTWGGQGGGGWGKKKPIKDIFCKGKFCKELFANIPHAGVAGLGQQSLHHCLPSGNG